MPYILLVYVEQNLLAIRLFPELATDLLDWSLIVHTQFWFWCAFAEGAREEDLDAVEAQIGCKLPDDYRCSYRIHNGQKLVVPG